MEGRRNYFTSIKKNVRSLILSSQQVGIQSRMCKVPAVDAVTCLQWIGEASRGGAPLPSSQGVSVPEWPRSFFAIFLCPELGSGLGHHRHEGHQPGDEAGGGGSSYDCSQGWNLCSQVGQRQPSDPLAYSRESQCWGCVPWAQYLTSLNLNFFRDFV